LTVREGGEAPILVACRNAVKPAPG